MNSPVFLSSLAPFLNQFVQYKRALNRKYFNDAKCCVSSTVTSRVATSPIGQQSIVL